MNDSPESKIPNLKSKIIQVFGYIRGSTEEQQNTLVAQRQQIEAYCQFRGFTLAECFVDSGVSGTTAFFERAAAARMIAQMQAQGVQAIVFPKLDRGFRNAVDCLFTVDALARKGIELHILDIQLDTSSAVGRMVLTMMAALAEFENRRRSERQLDSFAVLKGKNRRCGTVPYGWKVNEADPKGPLLPVESEQCVIRRIVELHAAGFADNAIANTLNKQGAPTKNGGKWFGGTVASIRKHLRPPVETPAEEQAEPLAA